MPDPDHTMPLRTLDDAIDAGPAALALWLENAATSDWEAGNDRTWPAFLQAAATYRCAVALEQIGHQLQLILERDR